MREKLFLFLRGVDLQIWDSLFRTFTLSDFHARDRDRIYPLGRPVQSFFSPLNWAVKLETKFISGTLLSAEARASS